MCDCTMWPLHGADTSKDKSMSISKDLCYAKQFTDVSHAEFEDVGQSKEHARFSCMSLMTQCSLSVKLIWPPGTEAKGEKAAGRD